MDIYFEEKYGKLYEKIENGIVEIYEYKSEIGRIRNMFIKREIPIKINDNIYYDITTPYGYGGPFIIECEEGRQKELVSNFKSEFQCYCGDNHIISEFVRFHPIIGNARDFKNYYEIEHIRNTVGTNLKDYDDPVQMEFSKSCRKNIRKTIKNGVTFRITEKPRDIGSFRKIYYSTMERNEANDYYYFDDEYFQNCIKFLGDYIVLIEAVYQDKTIASGLYFVYNKTIHVHLSGTLSEYLYLSPAYLLRYAITLWGKEKGYRLIHHGGGKSNSPEDSLYLYKKQFGKNTEFEYYIGKMIWNKEVYYKLCNKVEVAEDLNFFPAYRSKI